MPQQRRIPSFGPQSFQSWMKRHRSKPKGKVKGDVLLWPDTFNNYFHPETAQAAVEVLEGAGYNVIVPKSHVCCGRPLYDFGFLTEAKRYLRRNFEVIEDYVDAGVPMVVLEPSCASVFRDEMVNLMPNDAVAKRLNNQTFLLSEFLEKHADGYQPPPLKRKMLVHAHCHHKALLKMGDEKALIKKMGADAEFPDTGCCGMAGPFGFEREKYEVSIAAGERVLLPAVRHASEQDIIVADGFSCREQIAQQTDRHALHLAEVLQLAHSSELDRHSGQRPEQTVTNRVNKAKRRARLKLIAVAAIALAACTAMASLRSRPSSAAR
jgi:Fe-S oxidoreductase